MCLTNLLESLDDWIAILDISNVKWLILYFCICEKHFTLFYTDDLQQNYLLMVSQARQLATWLPELLGDRLQKIVLNQAMSEWTPVASGIPKESVLGPLLFLLIL